MSNKNDVSAEVVFEYTGKGCAVPKNVTIVRFHPSVVEIEDHAFDNCNKLREVIFNNGLKKIGEEVFYTCTSLSSITLPSTVIEIGGTAFYNCHNLQVVEFNEGLQKIGRQAFYQCKSLSSIKLPSTITEIGKRAFEECRELREVVGCISLPTEIGNYAFRNCINLREVKFHEGLQKIGHHAFEDCRSLSSITLPSTVTEIGIEAFDYCNNLTEVMMHGVPREIGNGAFYSCSSLERFTFPAISTRLDNLIQTGHWEEIENEVNEVRGVVERSGGDLFVSTQTMDRGNSRNAASRDLGKIVRLISCFELKEATSILELALWKFKLDQVDEANPIPRKKCRMDVPGPVKDIILQYLPYECLQPVPDIQSSSSESGDNESSDGDDYESSDGDDY